MQTAEVLYGGAAGRPDTIDFLRHAEHGSEHGRKPGVLFLPIGTLRALAKDLGITGTPGFIVATELVPGALDLTGLKDLVARARKN